MHKYPFEKEKTFQQYTCIQICQLFWQGTITTPAFDAFSSLFIIALFISFQENIVQMGEMIYNEEKIHILKEV